MNRRQSSSRLVIAFSYEMGFPLLIDLLRHGSHLPSDRVIPARNAARIGQAGAGESARPNRDRTG